MRTLPTREALVAAYWRKLASSIETAYKGRGRVFSKTRGRRFANTSTPLTWQRRGQRNPCHASSALTNRHVDCSVSSEAAVHLYGDGHSDRAHGHCHDHAHGYRHFSQDRHPRGERDLELSRRRARGNGETLRHGDRACHDHDRKNRERDLHLSDLPLELQEYMKDYIQQFIPRNRVVHHWFDVYDLEEERI